MNEATFSFRIKYRMNIGLNCSHNAIEINTKDQILTLYNEQNNKAISVSDWLVLMSRGFRIIQLRQCMANSSWLP